MKTVVAIGAGACLLMMAAPAFAAEPRVGFWQMISQQIGKNRVTPSPLAIHVSEAGGALRFDYLPNREFRLGLHSGHRQAEQKRPQ